MYLSVQLDSSTNVTGVVLNLEERKAVVNGRKPDGSHAQAVAELTDGQAGHLGGGEKIQLKFPDGKSSEKIDPLYLSPNENPSSGMVWPLILAGVALAVAVATGWWVWRRHVRMRAVSGFKRSAEA